MRIIGLLVIVFLLAFGAYHLFTQKNEQPQLTAMSTYENEVYGFSFSYPAGYVLAQSSNEPYTITLVREEDSTPRVDSEGPVAVTISVYKDVTLGEWLASSSSNLQLGDGTTASTTVAGKEVTEFSWSGLYEGKTTALAYMGNVIAISSTTNSPDDSTQPAYRVLLSSFTLH